MEGGGGDVAKHGKILSAAAASLFPEIPGKHVLFSLPAPHFFIIFYVLQKKTIFIKHQLLSS